MQFGALLSLRTKVPTKNSVGFKILTSKRKKKNFQHSITYIVLGGYQMDGGGGQ